jgi:hypothetical protein
MTCPAATSASQCDDEAMRKKTSGQPAAGAGELVDGAVVIRIEVQMLHRAAFPPRMRSSTHC